MFTRQAQGDYEIYTIKPEDTGIRQWTCNRGNDAHIAWSPDGGHIVFASTRMGFKDETIYSDAPQPYGEIFVMRADGGETSSSLRVLPQSTVGAKSSTPSCKGTCSRFRANQSWGSQIGLEPIVN